MEESAITPAKPAKAASNPLAKFPPEVRAAHQHFLATGDIASLDRVVLAVVHDHQPRHLRTANATFADSATLIGELGFDSLALAEIVFFIEDLYQVSITQQELATVTTVGDLRSFIRAKLTRTQAG